MSTKNIKTPNRRSEESFKGVQSIIGCRYCDTLCNDDTDHWENIFTLASNVLTLFIFSGIRIQRTCRSIITWIGNHHHDHVRLILVKKEIETEVDLDLEIHIIIIYFDVSFSRSRSLVSAWDPYSFIIISKVCQEWFWYRCKQTKIYA